jgi:hypothetical protein
MSVPLQLTLTDAPNFNLCLEPNILSLIYLSEGKVYYQLTIYLHVSSFSIVDQFLPATRLAESSG